MCLLALACLSHSPVHMRLKRSNESDKKKKTHLRCVCRPRKCGGSRRLPNTSSTFNPRWKAGGMVRKINKENGGQTNASERATFACILHVKVGPYNACSHVQVMFSCLGEWSKKKKRGEGTYLAPVNLR